jgi:ribosomal protein S18 acetylase RimI-like enzyme
VPDIATAASEAQSVRKASAAELRPLARALAQAFFDDPHAVWTFPADDRRLARLDAGFATGLEKLFLAQDHCYTTAGIAGAAIWMRPGQARIGMLQQLRLTPSILRAYGRDIVPMARLMMLLDSMHPHEREHWYLPFVGVVPEWQGRGIGAALLQPVLERCDAEGMPAYLEATTDRNRALYERSGFEVTGEYRMWNGGPVGWNMWREPSPAR